MNINDKIKQILIDKNLTPSYFADEIGVQRSSISHILSGRNRPSFDIIQKIIRRFPELGYEWIMEEVTDQQYSQPERAVYGGGRSTTGHLSSSAQRDHSTTTRQPSVSANEAVPVAIRSLRTEIPPSLQRPLGSTGDSLADPVRPVALPAERKVEKILIFYSDGSFREYSPSA